MILAIFGPAVASLQAASAEAVSAPEDSAETAVESELTPQEALGRQIYFTGDGAGRREITAIL